MPPTGKTPALAVSGGLGAGIVFNLQREFAQQFATYCCERRKPTPSLYSAFLNRLRTSYLNNDRHPGYPLQTKEKEDKSTLATIKGWFGFTTICVPTEYDLYLAYLRMFHMSATEDQTLANCWRVLIQTLPNVVCVWDHIVIRQHSVNVNDVTVCWTCGMLSIYMFPKRKSKTRGYLAIVFRSSYGRNERMPSLNTQAYAVEVDMTPLNNRTRNSVSSSTHEGYLNAATHYDKTRTKRVLYDYYHLDARPTQFLLADGADGEVPLHKFCWEVLKGTQGPKQVWGLPWHNDLNLVGTLNTFVEGWDLYDVFEDNKWCLRDGHQGLIHHPIISHLAIFFTYQGPIYKNTTTEPPRMYYMATSFTDFST